jgi:hypothetical protein
MLRTVTVVGASGARETLDAAALLDGPAQDRVRSESNRFIKQLRLADYAGRSMRDRFLYRGDSLWWFTELYLHKMRQIDAAIATILTLQAAGDRLSPARLEVEASSRAAADAARAFGAARGIDVQVTMPGAARRVMNDGWLVGVSALLSRLRRGPLRLPARARVAAFVHTAFWRPGPEGGRETYIGEVLDALGRMVSSSDLQLIGVGPRRSFTRRRWWDPVRAAGASAIVPIERLAPRAALRGSLTLWRQRHDLARQIVAGRSIRDAGRWGDFDLWPILGPALAEAARVQWPWSARAIDEAEAALDAVRPDVIVTYAEAGGWGRALMLAARRAGIPSVGLQHGFIYRHWLNYQHEPDEMQPAAGDRGFPRPDLTLLFDGYAVSTLEDMGRFPPSTLRVTGSPRLDSLQARCHALRAERTSLREALAVPADGRLLVLTAKASEIAPQLPALFAAVRAQPGLRLAIKPHPAETEEPYRRAGAGGVIDVRPADTDLASLLSAADALVTRNSTLALDALVLGLPAIVVGLPSNLSPFVEAGVMAGADEPRLGQVLQSVLYDRTAREALIERGRAFADAYRMQPSGQAADQAARAILDAARHGSGFGADHRV